MSLGTERFILKSAITIPVMLAALMGIGIGADSITSRFGSLGWLAIIPGVLALAGGALAGWGSAITWLDRRRIRRYRVDPRGQLEDGQTIAVSGHVRISDEPLVTPFSNQHCAAFSYRVTGEGRRGSDNHSRQQLCLIGFGLADAVLDCRGRTFPLRAVPDVGTDLREIATSSDWRDRAMERIIRASKQWERSARPDAEGRRIEAGRFVQPRLETHLFVAGTRGTSNSIGITEDRVPIDQPVTVLATYDRRLGSLTGGQVRDMKVFAGHMDDKLAVLDNEWRNGLLVSLLLVGLGLALLTLAYWWPS